MARTPPETSAQPRPKLRSDDLLLVELNHRCNNDLQLVVGLLGLQSRRVASREAKEALNDAMERVSVLARARSALQHQGQPSLETALRQVCEALHSQSEPRGIVVSLKVGHNPQGLSSSQVMTIALAVNELATNAIKHAFEENKSGYVRVSLLEGNADYMTVIVDDDGLPFPELSGGPSTGPGLGLGLVKRLIASTGGLIIMPVNGSKIFEIRIPKPQ